MKLSDRHLVPAPDLALNGATNGAGANLDGSERLGAAGGSTTAGDGAISAPDEVVADVLLKSVEEIVGSANSLIEVYSDRFRLSFQKKITHAAILIGVAVCTAVWLSAAALAALRGVCGGFTALFDERAWLGDLTGGISALALAAGVVALHLKRSSRRELVRLKAKYDRIRK